MPSALNDGNAWSQRLLLVWVEAPRWQPQHLSSLICLFLWPPALPCAVALWAPLSKTKALCQTGPCSHVSSCLTSKEWLVTNMQGWFAGDIASHSEPCTHFCLALQREWENFIGLSVEAARVLSTPLGGAAESWPRCTSLCSSPPSPILCLHSPPLIAAHSHQNTQGNRYNHAGDAFFSLHKSQNCFTTQKQFHNETIFFFPE